MRRTIVLLIVSLCLTGCSQRNEMSDSLDRFERAMTAVFQKVGEDSVISGGQLGGSMSVERPGYSFRGDVIVGYIVRVDGEIRLEGVEGQMQGGLSFGPRREDTP